MSEEIQNHTEIRHYNNLIQPLSFELQKAQTNAFLGIYDALISIPLGPPFLEACLPDLKLIANLGHSTPPLTTQEYCIYGTFDLSIKSIVFKMISSHEY